MGQVGIWVLEENVVFVNGTPHPFWGFLLTFGGFPLIGIWNIRHSACNASAVPHHFNLDSLPIHADPSNDFLWAASLFACFSFQLPLHTRQQVRLRAPFPSYCLSSIPPILPFFCSWKEHLWESALFSFAVSFPHTDGPARVGSSRWVQRPGANRKDSPISFIGSL